MVAQVESESTAISFNNPVRIKKIHVVSGQEVKLGDLLIEVERPDLDLDIERKSNELSALLKEIDLTEVARKNELILIDNEAESKIAALQVEINEIRYKSETSVTQRTKLAQLMSDSIMDIRDTSSLVQINHLQDRITLLKRKQKLEKGLLKYNYDKKSEKLNEDLSIIQAELENLRMENDLLLVKADFDGTVGNVNIQVNELIPSFKTLITLYGSTPAIIKAYVNENLGSQLAQGQEVLVVATNRDYSLPGVIIEIGSRVTSFPQRIFPGQTTKYGQEVFVRIDQNNRFLNGEQVYVYLEQNGN